MANVNGKDVVLKFSLDGGTTKKIMVCETDSGFSGTTEITSEQTKCDGGTTSTAAGAKSWSFDGAGVVKKVPATGEVSYQDLLEWWNTGVEPWVEETDTDGTFLHQGYVIITKLDLRNPVNGSSAFTITLTGNGALTI